MMNKINVLLMVIIIIIMMVLIVIIMMVIMKLYELNDYDDKKGNGMINDH